MHGKGPGREQGYRKIPGDGSGTGQRVAEDQGRRHFGIRGRGFASVRNNRSQIDSSEFWTRNRPASVVLLARNPCVYTSLGATLSSLFVAGDSLSGLLVHIRLPSSVGHRAL